MTTHFTIECYKCKHYYITWDKKFPYGCRSMAFKSKILPSITVYKNSGIQCQLFQQKEIKKK
ncbi:MAG: uracil-DNA glycosylase [Desulfobacterium sp.]|nr:uracil-DNA glycosylase [Desulfobacterium sp.]